MNAVTLEAVTKTYRHSQAVRGLSLEIEKGEVFGLLGPNGAGKTTTIRMMINLIAPDSGKILILGEPPSKKTKRRIGYMPEERGLYKDMKVEELLLFFATIKYVSDAEARKRVEAWLSRLGLLEWRDKTPGELSKGMAQKLQFIIAVLHEPELLILDEPFSGFDPVVVKSFEAIVCELKQKGTTIIFSTHQMDQVEQMCDRICLMKDGSKVLEGSLAEMKRRFGANTIRLSYEGPNSFLENGLVKSVRSTEDCLEVRLKDGADPQDLLKKAISVGARVLRFELAQTSLRDIFISAVENRL